MSELSPCPFCGGRDVVRLKKCVQCNDCGAQGPYTSEDADDDKCEQDWNARHAGEDTEAARRMNDQLLAFNARLHEGDR